MRLFLLTHWKIGPDLESAPTGFNDVRYTFGMFSWRLCYCIHGRGSRDFCRHCQPTKSLSIPFDTKDFAPLRRQQQKKVVHSVCVLCAKSRWQEKKNLRLEVITERFRIWTSKSQPAYPPTTRPHRRQSCPEWAETTVGLSNSFDTIFLNHKAQMPCALDIEYVHSTLSFF